MTADTGVDYQQLNGLLWRYRPWLDRLELLFETQLMVTASARDDWQRQLAELFQETAAAMASLDLEREVLTGGPASLRDLAATAPEPWDAILTEQHTMLESATSRLLALRQRNSRAIDEAMAGMAKLIDALAQSGGQQVGPDDLSYGDDGRFPSRSGASILYDGRM